jgi:flagellar biosynthesis protein FliP
MEDYSFAITVVLAFFAMTSFAKCVTVFSILRLGLGISGAGIGIVVVLLSAVLAGFSMSPQMYTGIDSEEFNRLPLRHQLVELEDNLAEFLTRNSDARVHQGLLAAAPPQASVTVVTGDGGQGESANVESDKSQASSEPHPNKRPFLLLTLSFLLTELGEAFKLGILVLVPLLVVDLVSLNAFSALGIGYNYQIISLPAKLLLFYVLNGWLLVAEKLLFSYKA